MSYCAYIVKVEHLRKHPNADKMQLLDIFGTTTCVDLNVRVGDYGIYFPSDGQLSDEFARTNDLVRRKDENGNNCGGYLDPDKRNIKAISLRGEKSDGLYLPLSCLASFGDITQLHIGDIITVFNGHTICQKYIPNTNKRVGQPINGNRTRKHKVPLAPLFMEHADTEQLAYNLGAFKVDDLVEITLKVHGTSQRTGYLPVLQGYKRTFWDKIFHRQGTPIYDWGYVTGTRRVVLGTTENEGFYGSNEFREVFSKFFEGKLWKGEEIFYEILGFTTTGQPIMASVSNKKLNNKNFVKQYGETTTFSYGCEPDGKVTPIYEPGAQARMLVYRMTMTNPDGDIVEYPPDFMRYRCEQMGVEYVPLLWRGLLYEQWKDSEGNFHNIGYDDAGNPYTEKATAGEVLQQIAEQYYEGVDPIGKTHIREGVVCRIVNRPKFCAYKHKGFQFKCIEGLAKTDAEAPDIEEAQELIEENV